MSCDSWEEKDAVLKEMFLLKSFNNKMGQPKVSNWFAWNDMAHDLMREFHATKCVFERQLQPQDDPDDGNPFDSIGTDPKAQLQAIVRSGGGLHLAYKLMKTDLLRHMKILYTLENACWDWYTAELKNTKTPRDGLLYNERMATGWRFERHLSETLRPLWNPEDLNFMEIPMGMSKWADRSLEFARRIHAKSLEPRKAQRSARVAGESAF